MSKINVIQTELTVNEVDSSEYWFFSYDENKKKIKAKTQFVEGKAKTKTKWSLFAATTEKKCEDEIARLGLT